MNLNYKVDPEHSCIKYIKSHDEIKFTSHSYKQSVVRGDFCNSLISIIFNTNNLKNTEKILKEFEKKTKYPERIQFCIKIDNDIEDYVIEFLQKLSNFKFNFVVISSPKGRGFVDLWQWVNFLYKSSSKKSKFVLNISDEMYVKNKNWDIKLEKYIQYFDDNIFRLRTSVFKNRNYYDLYECGYAPDTTAIYTRRYLEIQGDFSPCFGPDNGQQFVAFYLSKINLPRHYQFSRDVVAEGLDFEGQGTNVGLTELQKYERSNLNFLLWRNMFRYSNQNMYFQRARKIQIEILKYKYKDINIKNFGYKYHIDFVENNKKKYLILKNYLSKFNLFIFNLSKLDFIKNNTGYSAAPIYGYFVTLYFFIYKKLPNNPSNSSDQDFTENFEKISIFIDSKISIFTDFLKFSSSWTNINFGLSNFFGFINYYLKLVFFVFFFFAYISYKPGSFLNIINQFYNRFTRNQKLKVKSKIFTENSSDHSKTIIVKGE